MPKIRVELFFKTPDQLRDSVRFLASQGITSFNLVNKNKQEPMVHWVETIQEECPQADVCAHYSLKYNKIPRARQDEAHVDRLTNFMSVVPAHEVLIVTGTGTLAKSSSWNTVKALQFISPLSPTKAPTRSIPRVAVAYNPYFPDTADQAREDESLAQKLATGRVDKIYLQFGTDTERLERALGRLSTMLANDDPVGDEKSMTKRKTVEIAGSLFLPTPKLIAQQKFRPWNGVFLSPEFLSGPEVAQEVVESMIRIYHRYNVQMLWEAPGIKGQKDFTLVQNLIQRALPTGTTWNLGKSPLTNDSSSGSAMEGSDTESSHHSKRLKTGRGPGICLVLFGSHDVRLRDNRALELALHQYQTIIPVFLWNDHQQGTFGVTGALQVVLKDALRSLEASLEEFGLPLVCRNYKDEDTAGIADLMDIVKQTNATAISWNKEHTTESREWEGRRKRALRELNVMVHQSQSSLLYDPQNIELSSGFHGGHWGTLMPFLKSCKKSLGPPPRPSSFPETQRLLEDTTIPSQWPQHVKVNDLNMAVIRGNQQWDRPIRDRFPMSEKRGLELLEMFFCQSETGLTKYEKERSRADKERATSQLSPHLRVGTVSPFALYWQTKDCALAEDELKTFSRRLIWRDLAYYQLSCFPEMRYRPIRSHYETSVWVSGEEEKRRLEAWKWGCTGFPIVDAGMRELYATGWMTQSIRMVVASFLVEYLRVNWIKGCEWFHYTLVDADSAINPMMWQNAGKCGIDQWNFILSPVTASQDPTGEYTKKWVPELAKLPTPELIHRPWEAPHYTLKDAGVVLGETYPERIVKDLQAERKLSVQSTIQMRQANMEFNNDRGYDLISLPNGRKTVVFTKREYRIDNQGKLMNDERSPTKKPTSRKVARNRRR